MSIDEFLEVAVFLQQLFDFVEVVLKTNIEENHELQKVFGNVKELS